MLSVDDALARIVAAISVAEGARVPLFEAQGAVLAEDVVSSIDSPPFDKSMMDGCAVRAADCAASGVVLKVIGEVTAGQVSEVHLVPGTAIRIMTGAPIPQGADAVIPVEQLESDPVAGTITLMGEGVSLGANIVRRASNMRAGEVVLPAGRVIRAQELALLAELGAAQPLVRPIPRVAVLATGDELVDVQQTPGPGQIRNSNALMLAAQLRQLGAIPTLLGIARDDAADLREKIAAGLRFDFLCLSGGVSAGKLDLVPGLLEQAGVQAEFHKIRMKPGKPLWFGVRPSGPAGGRCIVFGLPGNPVSSMVCLELFVRTALRAFTGAQPAIVPHVTAVLETDFQHRSDRPTWFPARLRGGEGRLLVRPVRWQGSSDLRSTVEANCSVKFPAGDAVLRAGDVVEVLPWGRTLEIE